MPGPPPQTSSTGFSVLSDKRISPIFAPSISMLVFSLRRCSFGSVPGLGGRMIRKEAAINKADEYLANKDYSAAVSVLTTATRLVGSDKQLDAKMFECNKAEILNQIAIYKKEGNYAKAIEYINENLDVINNDSDILIELSYCEDTYRNNIISKAEKAFESGATSLTHTYNAMSPFHHRDGGAVGAGLLNKNVYCELICDGFHVSPEAVKLAYKMKKEKLILITDSMEATGMADGEYFIAGLPVTVKDGKARTHEGAIAGSTLSLIDGVKNLAGFAEIPFSEALYCATVAPAKMLGIFDTVGSLEVGKLANMLVLDEDNELNVREVIFKGEKI